VYDHIFFLKKWKQAMFKYNSVLFVAFFVVLVAPVMAQSSSADEVLKQLELSGKLDQAVQRSLERIKKKELVALEQEQKKENEKKLGLARNARKVNPETDFIYGNVSAPISIILYSDFECPYCQRFHDTPIKVVDEMQGKVNLVWRNFPLPFHEPMASMEASAVICAYQQGGNGSFWKYASGIMSSTKGNGKGMPVDGNNNAIISLASAQGLDAQTFKNCLSNESFLKKQISIDIEDGQKAGVGGTPGVIIINRTTNKVEILAGAVSQNELANAVKNTGVK